MKKQRKSRGLGMTFIIVCLVLSGCGAGTQEVALGSAEEYVQAAKTALAGQDSFTANFDATIAMNNAGRGSMTTRGTVKWQPVAFIQRVMSCCIVAGIILFF